MQTGRVRQCVWRLAWLQGRELHGAALQQEPRYFAHGHMTTGATDGSQQYAVVSPLTDTSSLSLKHLSLRRSAASAQMQGSSLSVSSLKRCCSQHCCVLLRLPATVHLGQPPAHTCADGADGSAGRAGVRAQRIKPHYAARRSQPAGLHTIGKSRRAAAGLDEQPRKEGGGSCCRAEGSAASSVRQCRGGGCVQVRGALKHVRAVF